MIAALLLALIPSVPTDVSLAGAESLIAPTYDPWNGPIPKLCWIMECAFHGPEMVTSLCLPGEEPEVCNERLAEEIHRHTNNGHPIAGEGPCT